MMDDDKILQEIISLLNELFCIEPEDIINSDTRIEEDLLITGDDAAEFLTKFVEQFNVDASGFLFDDYFEAEGFEFLDFFKKKREKKVLTVGDLERAVELGVLE